MIESISVEIAGYRDPNVRVGLAATRYFVVGDVSSGRGRHASASEALTNPVPCRCASVVELNFDVETYESYQFYATPSFVVL